MRLTMTENEVSAAPAGVKTTWVEGNPIERLTLRHLGPTLAMRYVSIFQALSAVSPKDASIVAGHPVKQGLQDFATRRTG